MQLAIYANANSNHNKMFTFYVYTPVGKNIQASLNTLYIGYTSKSIEDERNMQEKYARDSKHTEYNSLSSQYLRSCDFRYKVKTILQDYCSFKEATIIHQYCIYYVQLNGAKLHNNKVVVKPDITKVLTSGQIDILEMCLDSLLNVQ
jgi:hypothetical protein